VEAASSECYALRPTRRLIASSGLLQSDDPEHWHLAFRRLNGSSLLIVALHKTCCTSQWVIQAPLAMMLKYRAVQWLAQALFFRCKLPLAVPVNIKLTHGRATASVYVIISL